MIKNLAAYNSWQKSNLDRVTNKYSKKILDVFNLKISVVRSNIISSLNSGRKTISSFDLNIDGALKKIVIEHLRQSTKTSVSSGIREVTPDNKLSTWHEHNINVPVEETFVSLAEVQLRDDILSQIERVIYKNNIKNINNTVNLIKKRYLYNVKSAYTVLANSFFRDDDGQTTQDFSKEIIKAIFNRTNSHTEMIVRTETTRYFNDARIAYFQIKTNVDFVQIMAVTDGRISKICECRDGFVIPISKAGLKKYRPPFHPNCRSIQSPLLSTIKSNRDEINSNLGADFGTVHSELTDIDFKGRKKYYEDEFTRKWE
jgi:SPP1 gp7 family putative phage head morphogenesis protein